MNSPGYPSFWRRFWPPLALGLLGIAVLPLQLAQQIARQPLPEPLASLPPATVIALSMVNPLILLLLAALLGAALAHRAGLGSLLAGTGVPFTRRDASRAVGAGLALALLLFALDLAWAPFLGQAWKQLRIGGTGSASALALGMLYGGLTEEVMMRWGAMSLFAWGLQRLLLKRGAPVPAALWWAAILASALFFAAAHLPALVALVEPTPALMARMVMLNTIAGAVYGWLFWQRQLESAMLAHAATHVGFWLLALVT